MKFESLYNLVCENTLNQSDIHSLKLMRGNPHQTDIENLDTDVVKSISEKLRNFNLPDITSGVILDTFFEDYFDKKNVSLHPSILFAIAMVINGMKYYNFNPNVVNNRITSFEKMVRKANLVRMGEERGFVLKFLTRTQIAFN